MEAGRDRVQWVDEVYRRHSPMVLRTCLRFAAGDLDWAKDRMQDVFYQLAKNPDGVRNQGDPGGWLYRVAVNSCFMELRKQRGLAKVIARLLPGKEDRSPAPEGQVGARRSLSLFARALEELPPKQRAIMVMVHLEEKSQTDAATLLGLSKGQVSKLHQRALDTLRAQQWDVGHA